MYEWLQSEEAEPLSGETLALFVRDTGAAASDPPAQLTVQHLSLPNGARVAVRQYRSLGPVAVLTTTLTKTEPTPGK